MVHFGFTKRVEPSRIKQKKTVPFHFVCAPNIAEVILTNISQTKMFIMFSEFSKSQNQNEMILSIFMRKVQGTVQHKI